VPAAQLLRRRTNGAYDHQIRGLIHTQTVANTSQLALETYQSAMRKGLVPSDGTLSLAVTAAVETLGANDPVPLEILKHAVDMGVDVRGSAAKLLMYQLQAVDSETALSRPGTMPSWDPLATVSATESPSAIETIIHSAIAAGLPIANTVLNRATRMTLRARNYSTALQLCKLMAVLEAQHTGVQVWAAHTVDIFASAYIFSNLVFAFSASRQYSRLAWSLDRLETGTYAWQHDAIVVRALKRAAGRLASCVASATSEHARARHAAALARVRAALEYIKAAKVIRGAGDREVRKDRAKVDSTILDALASDRWGPRVGVHLEKQWSSS